MTSLRAPRILFALSSDFGEYVTANVFSRGGPFVTYFALPPQLSRYVPSGQSNTVTYDSAEELPRLAVRLGADIVILASGYLFPVNRIATPEALGELITRIEKSGSAVATTDPWLRIWALRPDSQFAIHSLREGGVDAQMSSQMQALQRYLDELFHDKPHVFAAPVPTANENWMPFYNPQFVHDAPPAPARDTERDEWLFVISREDWIFSKGFGGETFLQSLGDRICDLLGQSRNHLRFVGPPELGRFLEVQWGGEIRVEYMPFCNFAAFESALRRARVVVYWNVISSTLLYCLYYRIAPVFFGTGHQAKVVPGLYEHAVEHLYRGRAPRVLDLRAPLESEADALIERLNIPDWLAAIGADYARLPVPADVINKIASHNVS